MINVNVIALDLYDGKVATTQELAGQYMQSANEARIKNIINGAINFKQDKAIYRPTASLVIDQLQLNKKQFYKL